MTETNTCARESAACVAEVQPGSDSQRLVIVGGGFCGTVVATELLRRARRPLEVVMLEPRYPPGLGVAYSTRDPEHLLNVTAKSMSALADDPDHFVRWLSGWAGLPSQADAENVFAPRRLYGQYLQNTLELAVRQAQPGVTFTLVKAEVLALEHLKGLTVKFLNEQLKAVAVVLALGNLPPRALPGAPERLTEGRYQADPWSERALGGLHEDAALFIVGTGLTMVDLVVSLHARGHRGRIYALSRRGLLPQPHRSPDAPGSGVRVALPAELVARPAATLPELVRRIRRAATTHPGPWQEVVDSLRETTPVLWRGFSERDKRRYLRRLRPYWDAHRSRIAPQIADVLSSSQSLGQLEVLTGRLHALTPTADGLEAEVSGRQGTRRTVRVARLINATGPETDLSYTSHPLLRALLNADQVRPDATGLGLKVGSNGQVEGAEALPLYALGALRRNESYEGIAVPELRKQAQELAQTLLKQLTLEPVRAG